jgi:hypothetical protein
MNEIVSESRIKRNFKHIFSQEKYHRTTIHKSANFSAIEDVLFVQFL